MVERVGVKPGKVQGSSPWESSTGKGLMLTKHQIRMQHLDNEDIRGMACDQCETICTRLHYYMIWDDVWRKAGLRGDDFLCLNCFRDALGRPLHPHDFTFAPINCKTHAVAQWLLGIPMTTCFDCRSKRCGKHFDLTRPVT